MRNGILLKIGMDFHESYLPLTVFRFASKYCGLPMVRKRVFLVMLRKDIGTQLHIDAALSALEALKANPPQGRDLQTYLGGGGAPAETRSSKFTTMTEEAVRTSCSLRAQLGLPPYGSKAGSPVSRDLGQ